MYLLQLDSHFHWCVFYNYFYMECKYAEVNVFLCLGLTEKTPPSTTWNARMQVTACIFSPWPYRPYALTSRLHNNDTMLGVKTCRVARTCLTCARRACWRLSLSSQSVRGPGPARRYGMQGLAHWLHAWRWRTWQCLVWPPNAQGALLWRHMHIRSIKSLGLWSVLWLTL